MRHCDLIPIACCGLCHHNSTSTLQSIKFLPTDQLIIMIRTILSVVILIQLHHHIYDIILAHLVVISISGNDCFQKEGDIIYRWEWMGSFGNGTKVLLSSNITKWNIKEVGDTFELGRMVFQS